MQYVPFANSLDTTRGHGTHVAGSVAGKREGADGIVDGMAPNAKIAFFDIGFAGTSGLRVPNNPSTLFEPGQDATAKIHSASWGTSSNAYGFGERFYDSFMASNDDFLFIVAAGNDGENGEGSVGSPSICKNGISGKFSFRLRQVLATLVLITFPLSWSDTECRSSHQRFNDRPGLLGVVL